MENEVVEKEDNDIFFKIGKEVIGLKNDKLPQI